MGEDLAMQEVLEVNQVTSLPFGLGLVGADRHLEGAEKSAYLEALGRHQHEAPTDLWLPVDCMDERPTIALADGTKDPDVLLKRRAFQLAGGTVLATTKAAVAADAAYLRDAKNITDAYTKTYKLLTDLGIPDAAHAGCGASKLVELSVAQPVSQDVLIKTFGGLGVTAETVRGPLGAIQTNKQRKLEAGFYGGWNPEWHADFVTEHQPENFSYLQTADDEVGGHHASGLLLVKTGRYFAKNAFAAETGRQSFALTLDVADKIAALIGTNNQERALIALAFKDDSFNVANHIVAPGLEVSA